MDQTAGPTVPAPQASAPAVPRAGQAPGLSSDRIPGARLAYRGGVRRGRARGQRPVWLLQDELYFVEASRHLAFAMWTSRRSRCCLPASRSCLALARRRSGSSRRQRAGRSWSRPPGSPRCSASTSSAGCWPPSPWHAPLPARRRPRGQHHGAGPAGLDRGAAGCHQGTAAGPAAVVARQRWS